MKKSLSFFVAILLVFASIITLSSCDKNETVACASCGAENSVDVKFCSNCGNAFDSVENNGSQNNNGTQNNGDNTNNGNSNNNENQNNGNGESSISTAKDFLNKIASNTTISLSDVNLNFGDVTGINNSCVEKAESGYYVIKNVENLTIIGNETTITSNVNLDIYFLVFENCKNISISNVKFASNNYDYDFSMTYLSLKNCNGVTIKQCDFDTFGKGISFYECEVGVVESCNFKNLDCGAISAISSNVSAAKCNIKNCENTFYCKTSTLNISECNVSGIKNSEMVFDNTASMFSGQTYEESNITFTNCEFKDNVTTSLFAKSVLFKDDFDDFYFSDFVYEHNKLTFKDCKISDNLYCYGSLSSNNFVNCEFSNNEIGIEIPDITGWGYDEDSLFCIEDDLNGADYSIEYVYYDITTHVAGPIYDVVSQSKKGVVSKNDSYVVLTISKPAITIETIYWKINSAGGVEPDIKFTNNTDKQIAYVYFTVKFYDRMGTPAYCSIKNTSQQRLKFTGPLNAGETKYPGWEPAIYNSTVGAIKPLSIEVEFTDGTRQTITNTTAFWSSGAYYGGELKD